MEAGEEKGARLAEAGDRAGLYLAAASRQIAENLNAQTGPALHMYDGYGHAAYDTAPDYRERLRDFFGA